MKYKCNCCGYATLDENPMNPTFDICPVCYWENDPVQNEDPEYSGGANRLNLCRARKNFIKFGAIEERLVMYVRKPFPEEIQS